MNASYHKYAPWRRIYLVPLWIIQVGFQILALASLAVLAAALISCRDNNGACSNVMINGTPVFWNSDYFKTALHVTIPVYESVLAVLLILTITEIILLVRHKLRPAAFLIINIIKALIWTAAFVLDIIVDSKNGYVGSIILDAILLAAFLLPVLYGSIIFHRHRTGKLYKPVQDGLLHPDNVTYPAGTGVPNIPSEYETAYRGSNDLEANSHNVGIARSGSYNHQRDTRFETYRAHSTSPPPGSMARPIADVHVVQHEGESFEMGSRTNLYG